METRNSKIFRAAEKAVSKGALRVSAALALGFAVCTPSSSAHAQDDSGSDDNEQVALLSYLGLSAAEGSLSVGENTGSVEGQIIGSILLRDAAESIVDTLSREAGSPLHGTGQRVILLTGDETFSVAPYRRMERQVELITWQVQMFEANAIASGCTTSPSLTMFSNFAEMEGVGPDLAESEEAPFDFQASDILGILRTSSSLQTIPVTLGNHMLRNALIERADGPVWILPSEIADISPQTALEDILDGHRQTMMQYATRRCVGTRVSDENLVKIRQQALAVLGNMNALYQSKDGAPSPMDEAARAAALLGGDPANNDGSDEIHVLRVNVESVGGTVVTSENILTSFFVPGVTIRGGLVVSYRVIDPQDGSSETSGILVCRFPLRVLRSVTSEPLHELHERAIEMLGEDSLCDANNARERQTSE